MKYRNFGKTRLNVSEIGFGAWAIGAHWGIQSEKDSIAALHKGLDRGINFIDTAIGYGEGKSESIIGEVLKERNDDRIILATKIPPRPGPWPPSPYCKIEDRYPAKYIRERVEFSLKNLKRDYIDIMQLHTWTRAWNRNPVALDTLNELKKEGKIRHIGISTPEHDQNALILPMREKLIESVQLIFNIFEQEPAADLLPVAEENGIGVIVRMAFDEGVLTGKYKKDHVFPDNDFRSKYFAGDRVARAVTRVEKIKKDIANSGYSMPEAAVKFSLAHPAISTVITGIRNTKQAERNAAVSDLMDPPDSLLKKLRKHAWQRAFWYTGK
ncbi:aldo/keto reductase [Bacteroidota bacterium]